MNMPAQPIDPGTFCKLCGFENHSCIFLGACPKCGGRVWGNLPRQAARDASLDCALDLQTGRCTLEATAHCRQACPYQAMLRDGTVPASAEEVIA